MPKIEQAKLRKEDKIVLRDPTNNEILNVIFPNGIQVGLPNKSFNYGIRLPNLDSSPGKTENVLFALDGDIYFNGVLVAPSAGSNLTIYDEGEVSTQTAASIDFVGTAVTVTTVGNNVTATIEADPTSENHVLAGQVFG